MEINRVGSQPSGQGPQERVEQQHVEDRQQRGRQSQGEHGGAKEPEREERLRHPNTSFRAPASTDSSQGSVQE